MNSDFLPDCQVQNYGRYAAEPNEIQRARFFRLDERDLDFVNQRRAGITGLELPFSSPPPTSWNVHQ